MRLIGLCGALANAVKNLFVSISIQWQNIDRGKNKMFSSKIIVYDRIRIERCEHERSKCDKTKLL